MVIRARGCFFFFQAEDGIRDFHVTGVQTCALPIFLRRGAPVVAVATHTPDRVAPVQKVFETCALPGDRTVVTHHRDSRRGREEVMLKIGRASCGERVKTAELVRSRTKKREWMRERS